MKKALSLIAQFLLFLFVEAIGGIFYHPFGVTTTLQATNTVARQFVWDGLILMFLVYLLLLVVHALRKHLRTSAPISTIALVLAALAGYLLKIGFVTHNW